MYFLDRLELEEVLLAESLHSKLLTLKVGLCFHFFVVVIFGPTIHVIEVFDHKVGILETVALV